MTDPSRSSSRSSGVGSSGTGSRAPQVPLGVRRGFQVDALYEVVAGSILMGNPLFGPDLGVDGFVVALIGVLLLLLAVFLGGAGLGRGPLRDRLRVVAVLNGLSAITAALWALLTSNGGVRVLMIMLGVGAAAVALVQFRALQQPDGPTVQRRATPDELRAALFAKDNSPR